MADATVTVGALRERVRAFVRARDWETFHNPKDVAMALSIEASELLEHFLWAAPPQDVGAAERAAISDELADVVVYALAFANALDLDVSEAVAAKMAKNEARYPAATFKGRAP